MLDELDHKCWECKWLAMRMTSFPTVPIRDADTCISHSKHFTICYNCCWKHRCGRKGRFQPQTSVFCSLRPAVHILIHMGHPPNVDISIPHLAICSLLHCYQAIFANLHYRAESHHLKCIHTMDLNHLSQQHLPADKQLCPYLMWSSTPSLCMSWLWVCRSPMHTCPSNTIQINSLQKYVVLACLS